MQLHWYNLFSGYVHDACICDCKSLRLCLMNMSLQAAPTSHGRSHALQLVRHALARMLQLVYADVGRWGGRPALCPDSVHQVACQHWLECASLFH